MFCHLHQWMIERALDGDRPLPRRAQRHMARCPRCAQQAQQHQSIQARLQQEAMAWRPPPASAHATHRIMSAVRRAQQDAAPAARPWVPRSLPPALVVAAVLAIAWGWSVWSLWPSSDQTSPDPALVQAPSGEGAAWLGLYDEQDAAPFWTIADAAQLETWLSSDMEQEMEHLRHDAERLADLILGPLQ